MRPFFSPTDNSAFSPFVSLSNVSLWIKVLSKCCSNCRCFVAGEGVLAVSGERRGQTAAAALRECLAD